MKIVLLFGCPCCGFSLGSECLSPGFAGYPGQEPGCPVPGSGPSYSGLRGLSCVPAAQRSSHRTSAPILHRRALPPVRAAGAVLISAAQLPGCPWAPQSLAAVATFLVSLLFSAWSTLPWCFWPIGLSRALPDLLAPPLKPDPVTLPHP